MKVRVEMSVLSCGAKAGCLSKRSNNPSRLRLGCRGKWVGILSGLGDDLRWQEKSLAKLLLDAFLQSQIQIFEKEASMQIGTK
jgi:hypothetical protein